MNPDIQRLMDGVQKSLSAGRAILDEFKGKDIPAEKSAEVDKHFDEASNLKAQADRLHKESELKSWMNDPATRLTIDPSSPEAKSKTEADKKAAHKRVIKNFMSRGTEGMSPEDVKELSSHRDPDGGYLVNEEVATSIISKMRDLTQIRSRSTVITTTKGAIGYPTFDYEGDVTWEGENDEIAETDVTNAFGKTSFVPRRLSALFRVPIELMEDADSNVEQALTNHFSTRFSETEEEAFISGTGVNQPFGILNSPISNQDVTGAAGAFSAENIYDAIYAIRAVHRTRAAFLMHRFVIRNARKLRDNSGGAGTGQFLWQPGLQAGQPATLAGYPIMESEFMPDPLTAGADGDAMWVFGDWMEYWIVDRVGFSVQRLVEKYAEFHQVGIKMWKRLDGAMVRRDAFVRFNRNA